MLLSWWWPFEIRYKKLPGLQFSITDHMSLLPTPHRLRWTIPLSSGESDFTAVSCSGLANISTAIWQLGVKHHSAAQSAGSQVDDFCRNHPAACCIMQRQVKSDRSKIQQGVIRRIPSNISPLHDAVGSQILPLHHAEGSPILSLHHAAGRQIGSRWVK